MNRRQLVLAGGTVAFTAMGAVKRTRRRRRNISERTVGSAVVAVPIAVAVTGTHLYGWDIGEFMGGIWNFFGDVAGAVRDFVAEAIDKAVSFVLDVVHLADEAFQRFSSLVTGTIEVIATNSANVAAGLKGVMTQTYNMLDGAFANFREQAKAMLEGSWGFVKDLVTDIVPDVVGSLFGGALDMLEMLIDIGTGGIALLADFVRDPIGFVWDLISGLVNDAIEAAKEVGQFGFDAIWALFWTTLQTTLGIPEDPLDVLKGAWWLLQMAYYITTGNIEKIAKDLLPDAVDYFENEIRRLIGEEQFKIEEWVGMAQGPLNVQ